MAQYFYLARIINGNKLRIKKKYSTVKISI